MTSVPVAFVLIFAMVRLFTTEYVVYGWKMTLDDNLSLNPLITQLTVDKSKVEIFEKFCGLLKIYELYI